MPLAPIRRNNSAEPVEASVLKLTDATSQAGLPSLVVAQNVSAGWQPSVGWAKECPKPAIPVVEMEKACSPLIASGVPVRTSASSSSENNGPLTSVVGVNESDTN